MIDCDSIERMLRRIQAGDLSFEQATQALMDEVETVSPEPTSAAVSVQRLSELIDRLGTPPEDIIDQWCETLQSWIPSTPSSTTPDPQRDRITVEDLQHLGVDHQGQLVRIEDTFRMSSCSLDDLTHSFRSALVASPQSPRNRPETTSRFQVGEAPGGRGSRRACADGSVGASPSQCVESISGQSLVRGPCEVISEPSTTAKLGGVGNRRRSGANLLIAAGLIVCAGLMGLLMVRQSSPLEDSTPESPAPQTAASTNPDPRNPFNALASGGSDSRATTRLSLLEDPISSDELESFEQMSDAEIAALESVSQTDLAHSLSDLMPLSIASSPPRPATTTEPSTSTRRDLMPPAQPGDLVSQEEPTQEGNPSRVPVNPTEFPHANLPSAEPDEMEQATITGAMPEAAADRDERQPICHIELPLFASNAEGLIDENGPRQSSQLKLDFPTDLAVSLASTTGDHAQHAWQIVDKRHSFALAALYTEGDSLRFRWEPDAVKKPAAKSLLQGRLRWEDASGSARTIYLRPVITADPWRMDLERPDVRPTWDLGWSMPRRVSSISVELDLPEDLEISWIQPFDDARFRKQEGVVILKPLDGESVDLRVSLDVRCTRKLSCRVRYEGRLDSTMPWHGISRGLLDQFANQIASYSEQIGHEAERLQTVYDLAGSRGKRIIRIKQKRNDALAGQVRGVAKRVAELQILIGKVEAAATMRFRLMVHWPSGEEQVVFAMK